MAGLDIHPHNLRGHRIVYPQIEIQLPQVKTKEKDIDVTTQHYLLENLNWIWNVMQENFHVKEIFEQVYKYINRHLKYSGSKKNLDLKRQRVLKVLDMFVKSIYLKHYMGSADSFVDPPVSVETPNIKKFAISVKLYEFFQNLHSYI